MLLWNKTNRFLKKINIGDDAKILFETEVVYKGRHHSIEIIAFLNINLIF